MSINVFKEIRDFQAAATAILVMTFITSWLLSLSLGMTIVGAQASKTEAGEQFSALGGLQIALTCLSVLLCLPSLVKIAVSRDSRHIALWQVIGASPSQARRRYIAISSFSAFLGSATGGLLAFVSWPLFGRIIQRTGLLLLPALSDPLSYWAVIFGGLVSFLVLTLSMISGTRKMKEIEPVEAVSSTPESFATKNRFRYLLSLVLVLGVIAVYIAIAATPPMTDMEQIGGLLSSYWGTALVLLLAYGISDHLLITPVVRGIGLLPLFNHLDSWFIASTSAKRRSTLSTSMITPLVVAGASVGSIFGMVNQTKNIVLSLGASESDLHVSPTSQIILIFGAPVIISAFSGLLSVYLTNEWRKHDIALLQTLGSTISTIRTAAILECFIYFVSSVLISTLIIGINSLFVGFAFSRGPVPGASPVWFGSEMYVLLIIGFSLLSSAVVIPAIAESDDLNVSSISK